MKIRRLTICDWHGQGRTDTVIERPAWPEIESAIRALNNRNLNDIHLEIDGADPEAFLCVGGGEGQYIVSGSIGGQSFPTLTHPARSDEPHVNLVVGGQLADYPPEYVVDIETALSAARSVARTGGFTSEIEWTYA